MLRRSLIAAAALLAVGSPLTAQTPREDSEQHTWTADRPDANGLLGVFGDRTLASGELQLTYNFSQENYRGVYFVNDSLDLGTVLQLYDNAPISRSDIVHQVRLGFGLNDQVTLVARAGWAVLERETTTGNSLIRVGVNEPTDIEVGALVDVYSTGPYRMLAQVGAIIPTFIGNTTYGATTPSSIGPLPHDMRTSGGSFGVVGGLAGSVQNDVGSVGAQFRFQVNVTENSAGSVGYTPGDRYEANGWAAYNINRNVSILTGVRWQNWDNVDGFDDRLDPGQDPHNVGGMLAGQRVILPVGVNLLMPAGSPLGGHTLSFEAMYSVHHDYEGPQLGLDWGINVGYVLPAG
ncbi:MAG: hypothetical protein HKO77_06950 [Gemmatimonadetes bacterium]|nr:hypothetical protein [Gemmatimonadota bacterium]